jgi:TPR repeat protein
MRALSVMILLVALVLPSGHASASPSIDISVEELQTLHTQATQGYTKAQHNLGVLYAYGDGVPPDDVRAYMWLTLAAAHSTGDLQKYVVINRGYVARRMTPAQIAEAHRLSQQCEAQQFKGC